VDHFLEIAGMPLGGRGVLSLAPAVRRRAEELLESRLPGHGPLVVIQAGASRAFRGLHPDWVAAVQKRLPRARYAWLGSRAERAGIEACLAKGLLGACLAGDTGIPEAAAVIRQAKLLVSGDTAAIHLAALVGTPSVSVFFGSAQPFETGPYGDGHACLYEPPACAPCDKVDGCEDPVCKTGINADLLSRTCYAVLNGIPAPDGAWVSQLGPQGLRWERSAAPSPALRAY
jgi:ADP-heptose:LPS heptosyltransferase